jgi:hypothetical protein
MEEKTEKIGKIRLKIVERIGKYGRKESWTVIRFGKYWRKISWIVKRYGKHGRKVTLILKWFVVWLECYYEVTHCRLVNFLPGTVLVSVDYVVFLFLIRNFSIFTFKLWHTATNYANLCNMTEPKVSVNDFN